MSSQRFLSAHFELEPNLGLLKMGLRRIKHAEKSSKNSVWMSKNWKKKKEINDCWQVIKKSLWMLLKSAKFAKSDSKVYWRIKDVFRWLQQKKLKFQGDFKNNLEETEGGRGLDVYTCWNG